MIILDTNVLSELMRPEPVPSVVSWASSEPAASQYTTSITQAELLHGILLLPAGKRRTRLFATAQGMFAKSFAGRILGFGTDAALRYAEIASDRSRAGRPISQFDAQIASIARACGARIATRNEQDFEGCGVDIVNPWES